MKKLFYAGGHIFVSDDMAEAIIEYAHALADVGKSDVLVIPSMSDDETRGSARIIIGPSSELLASEARDRGVDLDNDELLAELRLKVARLQPLRPQFIREDEMQQGVSDFE